MQCVNVLMQFTYLWCDKLNLQAALSQSLSFATRSMSTVAHVAHGHHSSQQVELARS